MYSKNYYCNKEDKVSAIALSQRIIYSLKKPRMYANTVILKYQTINAKQKLITYKTIFGLYHWIYFYSNTFASADAFDERQEKIFMLKRHFAQKALIG